MTLKTVVRPALTVVGLHIVTRPMAPDIPALWPRFVPRIDEVGHVLEPRVSYGVMWPGANAMQDLHYMAAVSVHKLRSVPEGMEFRVIPGGTFASFRYPLSRIGEGFGEIFSTLLPASNYVQAAGSYYERYDEKFDPGNPASEVEICLPVAARSG